MFSVARLPSFLPTEVAFLLIRGTEDPSSPKQAAKRSKNFAKSLKTIDLDGAGHWLMVERKEEVTKYVGDWIESVLREGRQENKPSTKL
jgi:soluble epoxide hydrolase/lipid-phosphate phosphatase